MPGTQKKGSFFLGTMVGILIGCVACAAVALFITNAPIPFVEKVQKQSTPVDAAALDGKDPNSALYDAGTRGTPADDALSAIKTVQAPTAHERAEEPTNAADQATGESYSIQAGAFRNGTYADRLQQALLEQDFPAVTSQNNGLYRVTVGTYPTLDEAAAVERRLKQAGYQTVIVRS